jgi:hypothetical protein
VTSAAVGHSVVDGTGDIERSFGSNGGSGWPESASTINESAVNRTANPNIGGGISPARSLIMPAPLAVSGSEITAVRAAERNGLASRDRSKMPVDNRNRLGRQGPPLFSFGRPRFKMMPILDKPTSRGTGFDGTIRLGRIEDSITCPW